MSGAGLLRRALAIAVLLGTLGPGSSARAEGSLVVLLRSPAAEPPTRQSETLLAAELRAAGFEVREQERAGSDLRTDMDSAARRLQPIAVLALAAVGAPVGAEIWLLDRVTGKLVIRRIEPPPDNRAGGSAGDLALRAVELLRGSLLEIALEPPSGPGPAAPEDVSRFVTGSGPEVLALRRPFFHQGLGLGAAASLLSDLGALGPTYAPGLRLSYGFRRAGRERLALRLSGVGLGTGAEVQARDAGTLLGTAQVKRSLVLLEALLAFRRDTRWQPFLAAGVGMQHLRVTGTGATRLFADGEGTRITPALAAGGGIALRLGLRAALLLEGQVVAATSVTPVRVADQQVARVGRPAGLLSLGFGASW